MHFRSWGIAIACNFLELIVRPQSKAQYGHYVKSAPHVAMAAVLKTSNRKQNPLMSRFFPSVAPDLREGQVAVLKAIAAVLTHLWPRGDAKPRISTIEDADQILFVELGALSSMNFMKPVTAPIPRCDNVNDQGLAVDQRKNMDEMLLEKLPRFDGHSDA